MFLEVQATYENGVLKLDKPLPLGEHARVCVSVTSVDSPIERSAWLIPWTGPFESLDYLLGPENQPWEKL